MLKNRKYFQTGFTIVELLVVVGIITIIAGLFLPSFRTWRAQQDLTAAQRELITFIQRVRSNALAGRQMQGLISKYYAIAFHMQAPTAYVLNGVAYNAAGQDVVFDPDTTSSLEQHFFSNGIYISRISYERPVGTAQADPQCAVLAFGLPFGNTYLDTDVADGLDDDGVCNFFGRYLDNAALQAWSNAKVTITLSRIGTSFTKTIIINGVTGQIQVN